MSHLTLEALARLIDEQPSDPERGHLGACEECRLELDALRAQSAALAALPKMIPAPDGWPDLRERLLQEGLMEEPRGRWRERGSALRAAAATLLFLAGGALGYGIRGEAGAGLDRSVPVAQEGGAEGGEARLASEAASDAAAPAFAGGGADAAFVEQPGLQEVEQAQEAFLAALDQYMEATGSSMSDPAARLATLDNIVLTTAEALNEAPADPVINSFHLTALAQRNAMLRQIVSSTAEPVF